MRNWLWIALAFIALPVAVFGQQVINGYLRDAQGNLEICQVCHVSDQSGLPRGPNGELAVSISGVATPTPNPSGTPTPTPSPTPSPTTGPIYNGCKIFPPSDPTWNAPLGATPTVDPNNANLMAGFLSVAGSGATVGVSVSTSYWFVNPAVGSDFTGPVFYNGSQYNNISNATFNTNYQWEFKGYASSATDHHLMVVSTSPSCIATELYAFSNEGGGAYSFKLFPTPSPTQINIVENHGLTYSLSSPYPTPLPTGTCAGCGSVQNLGPLLPGVVRYEDYLANSPHAVSFDVPAHSLLFNHFVYPARYKNGFAFNGTGSPPPVGARLFLPTNAVIPSCVTSVSNPCPQTAFVVEMLQTEGGYISDFGAPGFTIKFTNQLRNGVWINPWNTTDLNNLTQIKVNEFVFTPPPFGVTSIANCMDLLSPNGC